MAATCTRPSFGLSTYATRVEQWECDFNNHWNTRYYGHSFDQAAGVAKTLSDIEDEENRQVEWHMRFHRELASAASVRVESSATPFGADLHILSGVSGISATALRQPGSPPDILPPCSQGHLDKALPRGLADMVVDWQAMSCDRHSILPMGMLAAHDIGAGGRLTLRAMLAFCGRGSHVHREDIGLGSAYADERGIGFMLVEMRCALLPGLRAELPVNLVSKIVSAGNKSFVSAHILEGYDGQPAARIEMCLVAVDRVTRRATSVPALLHDLT